MTWLRKCFGKNISNLKARGDERERNNIAYIFIPDKVASNLDVFSSLMKHWIFYNPNGTLVLSACNDVGDVCEKPSSLRRP